MEKEIEYNKIVMVNAPLNVSKFRMLKLLPLHSSN